MRHLCPLAAAAVLMAAPALGAEGGPILSGEHGDFSRIVLRIDPETQWSLETAEGRATLVFPGKSLDFGTGGIFDLIPRSRIADVTSVVTASGTTVELALACDCRLSTVFVDGRYLALDVGDRTSPAPAVPAEASNVAAGQETPLGDPETPEISETPEQRAAREATAVASAESILIQQIERAASQGIVDLSDATPAAADGAGGSAAPPVPAPSAEATPAAASAPAPAAQQHAAAASPMSAPPPPRPTPRAPTEPVALTPDAAGIEALTALLDGDQIRATTVYDRDRATAAKPVAAAPPAECLPDTEFDMNDWADRRPFRIQAADLSRRLLGEFDRPDPVILARRVQLDLRNGLGLEAEMLLDSFPGALEEEPLFRDLARAVEGRPLPAGGPLSRGAACPGAHGLWQAIGGGVPAFRNATHFAGVQAAFAELPPELRLIVGPTLMVRLLDAGQPGAARLISDTIARAPGERSAALLLAEARLVAGEGDPVGALQTLAGLVDGDTPDAAGALLALSRIAREASLALPDRLLTDLEAAALQARGTSEEPEFRALVAEAHATRGDLVQALSAVRAAKAAFPEDGRFARLAADALAETDPEQIGAAAYARAALDNLDLLPDGSPGDAARETVARRLIDVGLAPAAGTVVAPAAARGSPVARRLAAEALLRGGDAAAALVALDGLDDPEAVSLRAGAQAQEGAFGAAVTTLASEGREAEAAAYAWPSGDWPRVPDDAQPERRGMANFMAAQGGDARTAPAAPDPATLDGPGAFAEPVPSLADPSLDAARRLLTAGAKIEELVQGLLGPGAKETPRPDGTSANVSP